WIGFHDWLAAESVAFPALSLTEQPFLSVCLTHFNQPAFLREAVASLFSQDYPSSQFEVILVESGSHEQEAAETLSSLQGEFSRRRWRIFRQENPGLGAARNRAAAAAKGDYLLFMEDDSIARPEELSTYAQAAARTQGDIYTCLTSILSHDGVPEEGSGNCWVPTGGSAILGIFGNCFGEANALVKRQAFQELGGFSEERDILEVYHFFSRALLAGCRLELVPVPLYWCRKVLPSLFTNGGEEIKRPTGWEFRTLQPYRMAMPPALRELPFLTHGLWNRLTASEAERHCLEAERSCLETERNRLEMERSRLLQENALLAGECAIRAKPLRLLERTIRIARKRLLGR
ncbi:MAG: glycosyltransferase family 2 protein, partial [Candidatus Methylacidiphilaceae bacterium]